MQDPVKWHIKNKELDELKKKFKKVMGNFNALQFHYSDWFRRQQRSFLFDVKSMQIVMPTLVSQKVQTMKDLRDIVQMGRTMEQAGRAVGSLQRLQEFISYWEQFCEIRKELDDLMFELNRYVVTIRSLREPELKRELDAMYDDLKYKCSESYKFSNLNNEKDNLFTYGLSLPDQNFLGLVGYLPYLLKFSTKICFRIVSKIHLESE